jgi:hypothetical protein
MKKLIVLILCLPLANVIEAENMLGRRIPDLSQRKKSAAQAQPVSLVNAVQADLLKMAAIEPYRKIGVDLYDLNPRFRWNDQVIQHGYHLSNEDPLPDWEYIFGKVAQITAEGVLVQKYSDWDYSMEHDSELVFVRNFPKRIGIVDDSQIALYAMEAGRHQYVTVLGGNKTVRAYDFGNRPSEKEIEGLKQMERVKVEFAKAQLERMVKQSKEAKEKLLKSVAVENFKFRMQRALTGDGDSQLRVAEFYLEGEGTERDDQAARRWLEAAVTNGITSASRMLGQMDKQGGKSP